MKTLVNQLKQHRRQGVFPSRNRPQPIRPQISPAPSLIRPSNSPAPSNSVVVPPRPAGVPPAPPATGMSAAALNEQINAAAQILLVPHLQIP